jgi:DNA repair protein SbcD/Mre11
MTEFIFITANDIHMSDTGPRSRLDNFKETMLGKLAQMRMACLKLHADGAIIAGDLYNLKQPSKNSHRLNQELITEFQQFPCPIYMIEGNHDLTANRLESLREQPLGVLFADKTLQQLRHKVIEKDGHKISLVGIPYTEKLDLNELDIPENKGYLYQICVMHLYATLKKGYQYKERLYGYDELEKLSPDMFVLGHYHIDQGIYEQNGKYFVNIGSMSRGILAEDSITHHPQIGFIKIAIDDEGNKTVRAQAIKLKIKPAEEVFDLEKRAEEKKENDDIQLFVEKLAAETVQAGPNKVESIEDTISKMDMAELVRQRALHYIQEARLKK